MRQTPPQPHHRTADLIPQRHMALMVMHRRRRAAMRPKVHAAQMMAFFYTDAVVAAYVACVFGVNGAPAKARHECWALRGGVGDGCAVAVSVAHFDGFVVMCDVWV
jgi:hypothetical protein